MKFLLALCMWATITAICKANLQYDVVVSHLTENNKTETEEGEIFLEESFVSGEPPSIFIDDSDEGPQSESQVGRSSINLSEEEFEAAFGKQEIPREEHMNFDLGFGAGLVNSPEWSTWTCCRPVINIQSRERVRVVPRIEMEYRKCPAGMPYCPESSCKDNINVCSDFLRSMGGACEINHLMSTFMSQHCPRTCNFCGGPTTTKSPFPHWLFTTTKAPYRLTTQNPWRPFTTTQKPWNPFTTTKSPWRPWKPKTTTRPPWRPQTTTTRRPWRPQTTLRPSSGNKNPNLVKVTVLYHNKDAPYRSYMYSISRPLRISSPWKRIKDSSDVSSFYLYKTPTDIYKVPIHFCRSSFTRNADFKWSISKRPCKSGWKTRYILYASYLKSSSSQIMYVGKRGRPHWTSRVSKNFPSNGYTSSVFFFYAPKGKSSTVRPTPPPFRPKTTRNPFPTNNPFPTGNPFTTRRPTFTTRPTFPTTRRPTFTPRPSFTTRKPLGGGFNNYNRECLEAHNFFRAVHNVPPLQWSAELAETSKAWAERLKEIAPERPDRLVIPSARTRNWPHSESGRSSNGITYRKRGDGENIAWDLSGDGSPAKESVLRWYSEIFYYNRQHPTSGTPSQPVGHLTQMLWKDTTHIGCHASVSDLSKNYKQYSTWSVAHYSPGGNIRYPTMSQTLQLYNEMVPDMRAGSCMTKRGACSNGNQCMAFGPSRGTCDCNGRPVCKSTGGCIAWCKNRGRYNWKEECQGTSSCECTTTTGAVCK